MAKTFNLARVTTATTGAGTITFGSAVSGYLTFALAGAVDGDVISYGIKDGANSEAGYGVVGSSVTTLTRNVTRSTNGNAAISLSGSAEVYTTIRAEDVYSIYIPQGRLTLQTLTPVMTTTQSAKTTVYYTPYQGAIVPLYDGGSMVPTPFAELSIATSDTTKNPAAIGVSKVNDWFVWNDAGTIRLSHGPDWTNDTTRSAGTALVMVSGILLNNASITNGPAASRGTYVGSTRSNASSQIDYIFGAAGTTPTAGWLGVWNAYNRVLTTSVTTDSTVTWTYATNTFRQARAQTTAQCSFLIGLSEDIVTSEYLICASNTAADSYTSIGLDSTTTASGVVADSSVGSGNVTNVSKYAGYPGIGWHFVAPIEAAFSGTSSFHGGNNSSPNGNDGGFFTTVRN